jgi:hypothetical protein
LRHLAAHTINQDSSHGFSRGRKKVSAAIPAVGSTGIHQPQICFVNQISGLESLTGLLPRHLHGGKFSQFSVNER